jgi:transglutaminase-like putative cysteine protease
MKRIIYLLPFLLLACNTRDAHFITDNAYRAKVHEQFEKRKIEAEGRSEQLFSVFDRQLTIQQREALEFLYAYMPLCDLADYDGDFYLAQVNAAFAARDFFNWGKTVPEEIFRHFVLVHRVNNENLDTARIVFFNELKDRVKNMSMTDAALEVNHWCHEKVTYRGTDGRTSSPLALVRTSWGRCGEESTFTTAAMRAVGIPARQCYTPRWAHTDDNHAWAEVWIDGKWHYLGACEPEPELNVAWFNAPAKRAMMVHTNVFGLYNGPEEKNLETPLYSKINLLGNYTATRTVKVKVVDEQDKAVEGVQVKFCVYNYAEFYPVAEAVSNSSGQASIISGKGDLLIHANKNSVYGYAKSASSDDEITVTLNRYGGLAYNDLVELIPPVEQKITELSAEKVALNARRLAYEDSLRNAYMQTFNTVNIDNIDALFKNKKDAEAASAYMQKAQGNRSEIRKFILSHASDPMLIPFLGALSDKDLRDTPAEYLDDHITPEYECDQDLSNDFIAKYVLSPRIGVELIRPWRGFFLSHLERSICDAGLIMEWIKDKVKINDAENYYNCPLSPRGAYELQIANRVSRNILFVAMCRSVGIAARLEPSTGEPQYWDEQWLDATFEQPEAIRPKGTLVLNNVKSNILKPEYSYHYTIARFEDGNFKTLDYEEDPSLKIFPCKIALDTGYYRLITGTRANDGSVTVSMQCFTLSADETKNMNLTMPALEGKLQVRGIIDMNTLVTLADGSRKALKDFSKGKGLMLCFADPDKEPTKHVLQDLPANRADFESWGGGVLFLVPNDKSSQGFDASAFKGLPSQTVWGVDNNRELLNTASATLQLDFKNNFPLTLFLTNAGGVVYVSQGYKIGIGGDIITSIKRIENY